MSNPSKARGSLFERQITEFIRDSGGDAERLAQRGSLDEGDVSHRAGPWTFVLEAKAKRAIDLAGFVDEAVQEAHNYSAARSGRATIPAAVVKRPNRSVASSYVVIPLDRFLGLTSWIEGASLALGAARVAAVEE